MALPTRFGIGDRVEDRRRRIKSDTRPWRIGTIMNLEEDSTNPLEHVCLVVFSDGTHDWISETSLRQLPKRVVAKHRLAS